MDEEDNKDHDSVYHIMVCMDFEKVNIFDSLQIRFEGSLLLSS